MWPGLLLSRLVFYSIYDRESQLWLICRELFRLTGEDKSELGMYFKSLGINLSMMLTLLSEGNCQYVVKIIVFDFYKVSSWVLCDFNVIFYSSGTHLIEPTGPCSAGYYCVSANPSPTPWSVNQTSCPGEFAPVGAVCPVGHYCIEGSNQPEPCWAGSYQPDTGEDNCLE